jgi:hypothetical protein
MACAAAKQEDSRIVYLEIMRPEARGGFDDHARDFLRDLIPYLPGRYKAAITCGGWRSWSIFWIACLSPL